MFSFHLLLNCALTEGRANVLNFGSVAAKEIDIININKSKNSLIMLHKVV